MALPIGPTDIKVEFPLARPGFLPDVYIQEDHPLHKGHGKAYYYIQDGSPSRMARTAQLERNCIQVPVGGESTALAAGFMKILPGDSVFERLESASASGADDVAVGWLNGSELFPEQLRKDAIAIRDYVLGLRTERSSSMPTRGKLRVGGTRFERDFPEGCNAREGRCYPYGMSYKSENKIYAPSAQGKLSAAPPKVLKYRSELLRVTVDMAIRNLAAGPDEIAECLAINHELANGPSFGVDGNYAFGSTQINLAEVNEHSSAQSLKGSLGTASDEHIDPRDSPPHYSNMTSMSDLPPRCDPGRFFILYPGFFYELSNFSLFCFGGLRRHVGTPPIAAPGTAASDLKWATRVTLVSYPPTGAKSYIQRRPLCANGNKKRFDVSPEMIVPVPLACRDASVNHSTFVKEGPTVMPRLSLVQFLCRSFLQIVVYVLRQLPGEIGARVDSDAFLASFSYESEDGERHTVAPWPDGPGWRRAANHESCDGSTSPSPADETGEGTGQDVLVDQYAHLLAKCNRWWQYRAKYGGHIPYAVAVKKEFKPLEGWEAGSKLPKLGSLFLPPDKADKLCRDAALARGSVYIQPTVIDTHSSRGSSSSDAGAIDTRGSRGSLSPDASGNEPNVEPGSSVKPTVINTYGSRELPSSNTCANDSDIVFGPSDNNTHLQMTPYTPKSVVLPTTYASTATEIILDSMNFQHGSVPRGLFDFEDATSPETLRGHSPRREHSLNMEGMSLDVSTSSGSSYGSVEYGIPAVASSVSGGEKSEPSELDYLFGDEGDDRMEVDALETSVIDSEPGHNGMDVVQETRFSPDLVRAGTDCNLGPSTDIDWENVDFLSDTILDEIEATFLKALQEPARSPDMVGPTDVEEVRLNHPAEAQETPGYTNICTNLVDADKNEDEEVKPTNDLPVYLRGITERVVYTDLQSVVQSAIGLGASAASCNRVNDAVEVTCRLQTAVRERPLDVSTFSEINRSWGGLKEMQLDERIETLKLKQLRVAIMRANCTAWMWLEDEVSGAVTEIMAGAPANSRWLRSLVLDVRLALQRKAGVTEFEATTYGIQVDGSPRAVINLDIVDCEGCSVDNRGDNLEIERGYVLQVINKIARQWLGFPSDQRSYWQAVYVEALCNNVGHDVLYLDYVWKTFLRMTRYIMGGRRSPRLSMTFDPATHPLLDGSSKICLDIRKLACVVRDFFTGRLDGALSADHLQAGKPTNSLDRLRRDRLEVLQKFVRDSFSYAFRGRNSPNQRLDFVLCQDPDHFLIFREKAPTRVHLMESGGPFAPSVVRTVEGVFSAIVSRAITFNTDFSRNGRTCFASPDDFFSATREYGCNSESDYFNKAPYGQTNPGKKVDLIYEYWNVLHTQPPWPGLNATGPISFLECYDYFYDKNNLRFKHLGPLGAYLLTADYVYAGVVEAPSADVVARLIKRLNKGPMAALETLGLVQSRSQGIRGKACRSEDTDILGKFEIVHAAIKSALPEELHEEAGLDFITTEHTLCKFSRVTGGKNPIISM